MEDEASVIPAWTEPHEGGRKRSLLTWSLVPLAIAVVAVVVLQFGSLGGRPSAAPPKAVATPTAAPTDTPAPSATPAPSDTPAPTTTPAPVATVAPTATPAPPAATPAPVPATNVHVTGHFTAGTAQPTCDNNGKPATNPTQCQWGVSAAGGGTVSYDLTWSEGTTLRLTVFGDGNPTPLFTAQGKGSLHASVPNAPKTTVIVSTDTTVTASSNFDVSITLNKQ